MLDSVFQLAFRMYRIKCMYVVTCAWLFLHAEATVYLHEQSLMEMWPAQNDTDFGFSLSYQGGHHNRLVVGSPHGDLDGQVYGCPIENVLKNNSQCERLHIDLDKLAKVKKSRSILNENQHFCLGMSIISTPEYFMTCAPLWTSRIITTKDGTSKQFDSFGTCFIYYNETDVRRYSGLVEQHIKQYTHNYMYFLGTMGLSMIYDDQHELILIANPAREGEISYVNASAPTDDATGLQLPDKLSNKNTNNIGYAMAAGNFFSDINDTIYAFSMQDESRRGIIAFLQYSKDTKMMDIIKGGEIYATEFVNSDVKNSLFGAALSSADLNSDGVMELLIGAPVHSEDESAFETGALFIFIGGSTGNKIDERRRVVHGNNKNGARFGTTIDSSDLDGDAIPEIFVSAPYEDGYGVLYILSGYELNKILINSEVRSRYLEDFNFTQKIKSEKFRWFGFSLQVVPNVDGNGCDNLAVGSPKTANVVLLRCIPRINVTLSGVSVISTVKEFDENFTYQICINVSYHELSPPNINTKLVVTSEVVAGSDIEIKNPTIEVDLYEKIKHLCNNVTVEMLYNDTGEYTLETRLESNLDALIQDKVYDNTWVSLSPYSVTKLKTKVFRNCSEDCTPQLNVTVLLGGRNSTSYTIGPNATEVLEIAVKNYGGSVSNACVRLRISGTGVIITDCERDESNNYYVCRLPSSLRRGATVKMQMKLNMIRSYRSKENIYVETNIFDDCLSSVMAQEQHEFKCLLHGDHVHLSTTVSNIKVTDASLSTTNEKGIEDNHEYIIFNNGSIIWDSITAMISIEKKNFLNNIKVSTTQGTKCTEESSKKEFKFNCVVYLMAHSNFKIIVSTNILKEDIKKNLINDKLELFSNLVLILDPSLENKTQSHKTTIIYEEKLGVGHNKTLIIIIASVVALVVLTIFGYVLYKIGFFKRKEKARLEGLKESITNQSIKPINEDCDEKPVSTGNTGDFEMHIVDDCPFEVVNLTAVDNPAYDHEVTLAQCNDNPTD